MIALVLLAQALTQRLLASNRVSLDALANGLLEREVLSGAELETLLGERLAPMAMAG